MSDKKGDVDFNDQSLYLNRELNWICFNEKVLYEAMDKGNPLLERVKFLSIFHNNLDEFFMVRVSGLVHQYHEGVKDLSMDGKTPADQLMEIRSRLSRLLDMADKCWEELRGLLASERISIMRYSDLDDKTKEGLRKYFIKEIFPIITPMAIDPGRPFPKISNLSLNLLVMLQDPGEAIHFARVKIPDTFKPFVAIMTGNDFSVYRKLGLTMRNGGDSIWIEELIRANIDTLFPGYKVLGAHLFRVTRNADIEIAEDDGGDLMEAVAEGVERRHFAEVIRLEVSSEMPKAMRHFLAGRLHLEKWQIFRCRKEMAMSRIMQLAGLDRHDLKDTPYKPRVPYPLGERDPVLPMLKKRDLILYHPYDSFSPVLDFVRRAAVDPNVLAIKQTLYRSGSNSPIVSALMEARRNGKQVTVVVELKARFDEEQNIVWAKALEEAGVHVVYGLVGFKIHSKLCMVIRREQNRLKRYVHIGTGNYNPGTAKIYADLGFFTSKSAICSDVTELFNAMTGFSHQEDYRKILVSPGTTRKGIVSRIYRELEHHKKNGGGYIAFKMNQLVDQRCIKALYKASCAGVKIDLQIRGICCLRPGLPGVSENIKVTSLVGRFLEHARMFYFKNGGDDELFIGSADMMPRNLDRRVEVLTPIDDPELRASMVEDILMKHLADTENAWELHSDGSYSKVTVAKGETAFDSQRWMMEHRQGWNPVMEDR
ncbi:polyphosphate kinase 1 [Dethiosulfovibrio salsuginis]|uniref:Polyphosphate kinase n=1 Tax=Dethiosulfovibrio salsuginis TaxID=561720 RepID=A0A1X7K073_9BACT|nr:polyphosphate kinase 1 [Dethiosulfovibrio salsuginis]SMG34258.1 polyphosphate kinase [Dethiosulfovibrio salsuginis]